MVSASIVQICQKGMLLNFGRLGTSGGEHMRLVLADLLRTHSPRMASRTYGSKHRRGTSQIAECLTLRLATLHHPLREPTTTTTVVLLLYYGSNQKELVTAIECAVC